MRRTIVFLAVAAAAGAFPPACRAGFVAVHQNEASFLDTGRVTSTETFDEFAHFQILGQGTVVVDGITYATSTTLGGHGSELGTWIAGIQMGVPGYATGPNDFGATNIAPRTLSFGEGNASDAIGFYLLSGGSGTYQIDVTLADATVYTELLQVSQATGPLYRGFTSSAGIVSVTVSPVAVNGALNNWSFDNVSHGAIAPVPAPGPFSLLGTGAVCVFARALRRRPG